MRTTRLFIGLFSFQGLMIDPPGSLEQSRHCSPQDTYDAASSLIPVDDALLLFMPLLASPPDKPLRIRGHILRHPRPVPCRMPLSGKPLAYCLNAVFFLRPTSRTKGAPPCIASVTSLDLLPFSISEVLHSHNPSCFEDRFNFSFFLLGQRQADRLGRSRRLVGARRSSHFVGSLRP